MIDLNHGVQIFQTGVAGEYDELFLVVDAEHTLPLGFFLRFARLFSPFLGCRHFTCMQFSSSRRHFFFIHNHASSIQRSPLGILTFLRCGIAIMPFAVCILTFGNAGSGDQVLRNQHTRQQSQRWRGHHKGFFHRHVFSPGTLSTPIKVDQRFTESRTTPYGDGCRPAHQYRNKPASTMGMLSKWPLVSQPNATKPICRSGSRKNSTTKRNKP